MRNLFKITAAMSSTEIVLLIVVFIKNKYLANSIGTEGFGIYSLLSSFFDIAMIFSGTWLGSGITKYVSEYYSKKDADAVNTVYTLSLIFSFSISIFSVLIFLLFQNLFIKNFFPQDLNHTYFTLFALSFLGSSLRPLLVSFLSGVKAIRELAYSKIILSVTEVFSIIILVGLFSILGFFISIFIISILGFIIFLCYSNKYAKITYNWNIKSKQISKKLLKFSGVSAFLGLFYYLCIFLQRNIVSQELGLHHLGLFQAGFSIMTYIGLVLKGSDYYYFPKMSENLSPEQKKDEFNSYFKFTLSIALVICISLILFSKPFVTLLFNDKFLELIDYLYLLIIAQFITDSIGKSYSNLILGSSKLFAHSVSSMIISLSWILVPFIFIHSMGFKSVFLSILVGSIAGNTYRVFYSHLFLKIQLEFKNKLLMAMSVILIMTAIFIEDSPTLIKVLLLLTTAGAFVYEYKDSFIVLLRYKKTIKTKVIDFFFL